MKVRKIGTSLPFVDVPPGGAFCFEHDAHTFIGMKIWHEHSTACAVLSAHPQFENQPGVFSEDFVRSKRLLLLSDVLFVPSDELSAYDYGRVSEGPGTLILY